MFTVYLYLVLILIIIFIFYITGDQIILLNKKSKRRIAKKQKPIIQCSNMYFSPSADQRIYLKNIKSKIS